MEAQEVAGGVRGHLILHELGRDLDHVIYQVQIRELVSRVLGNTTGTGFRGMAVRPQVMNIAYVPLRHTLPVHFGSLFPVKKYGAEFILVQYFIFPILD